MMKSGSWQCCFILNHAESEPEIIIWQILCKMMTLCYATRLRLCYVSFFSFARWEVGGGIGNVFAFIDWWKGSKARSNGNFLIRANALARGGEVWPFLQIRLKQS